MNDYPPDRMQEILDCQSTREELEEQLAEARAECLATARLIAAAPDLLRALKNMVELARPYFRDDPQMAAIREARAAINRAEAKL